MARGSQKIYYVSREYSLSSRIISYKPGLRSRQIIAASKARGMTVTIILQTAMATATMAYAAPVNGESSVLFFNPVSARNRLPEPLNGAAAIYHTGATCCIDLESSPTNVYNN